MQCAA